MINNSVEALAKIDGMKSLAEAIDATVNADNAIDRAAGLAKVTASVAAGIAITGRLRMAFQHLRLGLALTGRIKEYEALTKVMGVGGGVSVEHFIDWVNSTHRGSWIYDMLNPDPLADESWRNALRPRPRDPLAIDLDKKFRYC
jgi:hypothetical protein